MQKKSVTIMGCGYLGKKLIPLLLAKNLLKADQIQAVVHSKKSDQKCLELGVSSICYDLDKPDNRVSKYPIIKRAMQNSILYYFVPPPRQGQKDIRVTHFLQMLQLMNVSISKVVLISTTGVYGNCHGQWVNEDHPLQPNVDRAYRRVDAEQQFQHYCQQLTIPLVILRVSGLYGAGKLPLKRIKEKTPIVRAEDSPFSNRIHVEDLLEICIKAGFSDVITGIFNCSDGHPTTMCDYFNKVAQAVNLPAPPQISLQQAHTQLSAGMLSYMNESRRIDNAKLLSQFKLLLKYPNLDKGLANESQ
ncbi:MAG: NAD-dependent epimerase/dehydratase family protein [Gammaproteobacteria bacterium]|nr:NAD-dependent epimerase/dehydratase family protein [Gammaproteobacteria bacterium]